MLAQMLEAPDKPVTTVIEPIVPAPDARDVEIIELRATVARLTEELEETLELAETLCKPQK